MRKVQRDGPLRTTNEKHFPVLAKGNGKEMLYRQPLTASKDGNTVEMNVEQMEFSENVMRYQTSLTFLNNRITGLLSAIRGE